ncbi:MAG: M17 family metallopeptidase [Burkholderiales bacterium]
MTQPVLEKTSHTLFVLPRSATLPKAPGIDAANAILKRRGMKVDELGETPISGTLPHGGLAVWMMLNSAEPVFEQQTAMRKALQLLLDEHPQSIAISLHGTKEETTKAAETFCAWVNGVKLPDRKKESKTKALSTIALYGCIGDLNVSPIRARAEANVLVRELTMLPPNELTPGAYRERIRKIAGERKWKHREFDLKKLRELGAGAFVAVAQGSAIDDAAIVKLSYRGKGAKKNIALVGKGICFDTGGHNLKPARYMHNMHRDMNGSAVALGILHAATQAALPVSIDCWMAIAQNHISPKAYKQNDVVTAINGTTIEIVHTDAEGRMVLADTLALAARDKPALIVDFATLTGAMHVALGDRYSGVLSNREKLLAQAVASGRASGERVCAFPLDRDYDDAIKSNIADVKQCTLESNADHILAARFLQRFVGDVPWLHMDLSASDCEKGLGAVASEVTGFGVGWGLAFLSAFMANDVQRV